jgi:hypothetical protein
MRGHELYEAYELHGAHELHEAHELQYALLMLKRRAEHCAVGPTKTQ